jgi:phosphate transport system substrate-binding protein
MRKVLIAFLLTMLALVVVVSCARQDDADDADEAEGELAWIVEDGDDDILPGVNPIEVEGAIVAAGSSTVFPLAEEVMDRFQDEGYPGNVTYTSIGSGAGFERFGSGETDISGASRPIKDSEREAARESGLEPEEFIVAFDALAVVVNPANDWASELSIEELNTLFSTASTWADVRDGFPEVEITRYVPGTDSGTFDYFVEAVFDEDEEPILSAANTQFSEDDNVLVQGVEGDEGGVGFFGFAYYVEESDRLTAVHVDGVEPNAATVEDGSYPLARPLFIYSDADIMRDKPQVAAFVNFFLTYGDEEAADVGYFPAPEARLDAAKERWVEIMDGMY